MNFAGKQITAKNGDTIEGMNLSQVLPHTKICEGIAGLTFKGCNLANCALPPDAVVVDCLQIQRDFCYHLHLKKGLPVEEDNCRHVIEEIEVDGEIIGYVREDLNG